MEKFTSILLITMFLLSLLASESCTYSTATSKSSSGFHRVELALYYDTLCPFSTKFIAEKLPDVFNKGLNSIVDLQLVPWGNAVLESNGTIMTCQHGDDECRLNAAEACVIELWPEVEDHFTHIKCIEQKLLDRKDFQSCFSKAEGKAINHCFVTIAEQLLLKHKAKTDSLKPPHTFVPWVVVNDQPLQDDYENYIKYVCKAYKGPPPEACKSVPLQFMNGAKGVRESEVCYASDDKQSSRKNNTWKKN